MYQNFNVEGLNIKKNLNTIKIYVLEWYVKLWYTKSLYEIILWYQLKLINYRLHNIDLSYLGHGSLKTQPILYLSWSPWLGQRVMDQQIVNFVLLYAYGFTMDCALYMWNEM